MKWKWVEVYPDAEIVQDENRHYTDIDFDNLIGFKMRHTSGKEFELDIFKGKPVHFYRNYIRYSNRWNYKTVKTIAGIENDQFYWFKDNGQVEPVEINKT